jgi:dTDP-4-amino-4,6-dideoxygalactose transaminase
MNQPVPLNDLVRQNESIRDALTAAARDVIDSGWYVLGKQASNFEIAFAEYCGVAHAVGVASGTDAIELGLRAVGVSRGDGVATVANAGFYTSTAIHAIGAKPCYVDIGENHTMSADSLSEMLAREAIRAVVVTHLYGRLAEVERIATLCQRSGIPVIEDCAQAHGAIRGGKKAGSFGSVGCFSFYPTKNLGALGDGGAVITSDVAVAGRLRELRQYGWSGKYLVSSTGGRNSRLDEMQAALLLVKLPHLDRWNEERREIARVYSREIKNPRLECPADFDAANIAHLFVVQCDERDALRRHLQASFVGSDIHYPIPDHQQPAYGVSQAGDLRETERMAKRILTLPCFNGMTDDEVSRVIEVVNAW